MVEFGQQSLICLASTPKRDTQDGSYAGPLPPMPFFKNDISVLENLWHFEANKKTDLDFGLFLSQLRHKNKKDLDFLSLFELFCKLTYPHVFTTLHLYQPVNSKRSSYCCTIYSFALLKPFPWTLVALDITTNASGSME